MILSLKFIFRELSIATIATILLLLTISCNHPQPSVDEIVGSWISRDGAELKFYSNGKVLFNAVPLIHFEQKRNYYGLGTWEFFDNKSVSPWKTVNLYHKHLEAQIFVERENFITGSGKIDYIFYWDGDPDSDIRIKFYKDRTHK